MQVSKAAIKDLVRILGKDETRGVLLRARQVADTEQDHVSELNDTFFDITRTLIEAMREGKPIPKDFVYDELLAIFVEQAFAVQHLGLETVFNQGEKHKRLAKAPPKSKLPRSFGDLQELWDRWRTGKYVPKREAGFAKRMTDLYIKRVQSIWYQHSEDFRKGNVADQSEVIAKIEKAADLPRARAKTIVETETTRNYNQIRKSLYDQSPDVTHYLFVSVRDLRTTKWCKTRHEVVFTKGTELFERNTPPVHWNCRSEILPLVKQNPAHKRLIDQQSRRAENRVLFPLPPGWNPK